jgi:hypothetical protein|tara:strand:- start:527 stop:766 length:240 start_codon:yes stop_codon:yes gene_type:complete
MSLATYVKLKSFDGRFVLPAESVKTAASTRTCLKPPSALDINVAEYEVPDPVKDFRTPPNTWTSSIAKSVVISLVLNVN